MADLKVIRWRRYGNDRLYVKAADGSQLGWHDLRSGKVEVTDPSRADAFHDAIAQWLAAQPKTEPPAAPAGAVTPNAGSFDSVGRHVGIEAPIVWTAEPPPASIALAPVLPPPVVGCPPPVMPAVSAEPEWQDLASHRAGQLAREQALALKAAAPVRTLLARALRVHTDERAWRIGADGEEKVAARLARLTRRDPRWRILHAIPVGEKGSDIDHLVIGPGGVYTLNAKHHPSANIWVGGDAFLINGQRQPYVRNCRHEASRASRLLSAASGIPVFAAGTVVVVGASQITASDSSLLGRANCRRCVAQRP